MSYVFTLVKRTFTDEAAINAIRNTAITSISAVLRSIGVTTTSGTHHALVKRIAAERGLTTAHWLGNGWAKGTLRLNLRKPIAESMKNWSRFNGAAARERLIRDGIKERRCERCKRRRWNGEPIPLTLHHVDGNRSNRTLENTQMLCPNCHAQTDNFAGKNKKPRRQ